jgi:hypothetical protein
MELINSNINAKTKERNSAKTVINKKKFSYVSYCPNLLDQQKRRESPSYIKDCRTHLSRQFEMQYYSA